MRKIVYLKVGVKWMYGGVSRLIMFNVDWLKIVFMIVDMFVNLFLEMMDDVVFYMMKDGRVKG